MSVNQPFEVISDTVLKAVSYTMRFINRMGSGWPPIVIVTDVS